MNPKPKQLRTHVCRQSPICHLKISEALLSCWLLYVCIHLQIFSHRCVPGYAAVIRKGRVNSLYYLCELILYCLVVGWPVAKKRPIKEI